ncbi:hypothetical protein [Deinococcus sp.]|nr:hypothetical protein [Deinococcus sp.]
MNTDPSTSKPSSSPLPSTPPQLPKPPVGGHTKPDGGPGKPPTPDAE